MYCIICDREFPAIAYCPLCHARTGLYLRQQSVLHITMSNPFRYEKLLIDGKETEITVFDGDFQNMLTEHNELICTCIIVGHHDIDENLLFNSAGFVAADYINRRYVIGIVSGKDFEISAEERLLTPKAMKAFYRKRDGQKIIDAPA